MNIILPKRANQLFDRYPNLVFGLMLFSALMTIRLISVNMWYDELDSVRISALVLFNEQKFELQWEGRNPMINWHFIQRNYNLKK
jgi:hypothetical protein